MVLQASCKSILYWPCSSWTFKKVGRKLVQETPVELVSTSPAHCRKDSIFLSTGRGETASYCKACITWEGWGTQLMLMGLQDAMDLGGLYQGEVPSCQAAGCLITGSTLCWSACLWIGAGSMGMALGQPLQASARPTGI